jgi:hypothetical protein
MTSTCKTLKTDIFLACERDAPFFVLPLYFPYPRIEGYAAVLTVETTFCGMSISGFHGGKH